MLHVVPQCRTNVHVNLLKATFISCVRWVEYLASAQPRARTVRTAMDSIGGAIEIRIKVRKILSSIGFCAALDQRNEFTVARERCEQVVGPDLSERLQTLEEIREVEVFLAGGLRRVECEIRVVEELPEELSPVAVLEAPVSSSPPSGAP